MLLSRHTRRREFIALLGSAAAAWPVRATAQQREQVRRIGILLPATADDPVFQARLCSIRSLRYWAGASVATYASSRIGQPLMLPRFASTRWNWRSSHPTSSWPLETQRCRHCYRKTHTIPIVFPLSADPVGGGFVDSLARPGGNATGFMLYEYTIGGKWLELLKEIAPNS